MSFPTMRGGIAGLFFLICWGASLGFGQAIFGVASSPSPGAFNGAAELTGEIQMTIFSGTSVAAPMTVKYSALITNNSNLEIVVTGTGGLAGIAANPTLDRQDNSIIFTVPAGGVPGNRISIRGVRVALAGHQEDFVRAVLAGSGGNGITATQNVVEVISARVAPVSVNLSGGPLSWNLASITNPSTSILIEEGFPNAFGSNVGTYGRTTATGFRFNPVPALPPGVTVTFPGIVTASTGATFETSDGGPATIPRTDGSSTVTYTYKYSGTPGANDGVTETFLFTVILVISTPAVSVSGEVNFQATLLPVGIATPNSEFPSTEIPRYTELTLPDEADLLTGSVQLVCPFRIKSDDTYTGIAIANPIPYRVHVTFTAYDASGQMISGPNIVNPATLTIPRKGQLARVASEIFGSGFNDSTLGSIRIEGKTKVLAGFYLVGDQAGSRLDGATADIVPQPSWTWPAVFQRGPSPFTLVELFNPGTSTANAAINLLDFSGKLISTAFLALPKNGTVAREITQLFPGFNPTTFTGGYLTGRSDIPLVARETYGNTRDSNVLQAQIGSQIRSYTIAHFAAGGAYTTELNLVNTDPAIPADLTLTALDDSGVPLAIAGNPAKLSIPPLSLRVTTMRELFPALSTSLVTGYLKMDVAVVYTGYFAKVPKIVGALRFSASDGFGSAALPLLVPPATDFVYSQVAQDLGYYTGVAMTNTNTTAATVNLEVFTETGTSVGTYTTTLQPGQKIAKLLFELVPASQGQVGGYVRINSGLPITSFALFGTTDGRSLSAIPPQIVN